MRTMACGRVTSSAARTALPFVPGNFDVDPDEGRAEAEQWLANWLQVKPESLRSLPAEVHQRCALQARQ